MCGVRVCLLKFRKASHCNNVQSYFGKLFTLFISVVTINSPTTPKLKLRSLIYHPYLGTHVQAQTFQMMRRIYLIRQIKKAGLEEKDAWKN